MKKFYKSFLVFSLAAFILVLSACSTKTPNVNDNMDIQDEEAVANTAAKNNVKAPEKKPELGEFSADTNPGSTPAASGEAKTDLASSKVQAPANQPDLVSKYSGAIIKTNQGDIKVKFFKDDSPVTVNNFLYLAQAGFYDNTKFHRVIKDFMIQGGDPNSKDDDWSNDGFGGPGYYFQDEINTHKLLAGSLAMANSGAGTGTNGSQFFIVTAASTPWLDGAHTNFGEVVSGMDIVQKIENTAVNSNDHPTEDMVILSIELLK